METCIYLFDKKAELTYKKQEHIITAGIGGRRTLPRGYVSDQANEIFSKYELKCLRYSPLLLERARHGPGKRGSININSINVPDVLSLQPILETANQNYICPLGFLFHDNAYLIPQNIIVFKDELKKFEVIHLRSIYQASGNIDYSEFCLRMHTFLMSSNRVYRNIEVPYDTKRRFACIGCYKKTWYICNTHPNFTIDKWASLILEKEPLKEFPKDYFGFDVAKPIFRYTRQIDLDYMVPIFIHAKNCFNVLALFKGYKFAQQRMFDQFRKCILTNDNWKAVIIPEKNVPGNIALSLMKKVQNNKHAVFIYIEDENVMAFSVLYGKSLALFKLGTGFKGESFMKVVICDYKNRKETLHDDISFL